MKKILTIVGATLFTISLSAQTFSAHAGINMANLANGSDAQEMYDAMDASSKSIIGLSVGVNASFELSDVLDLNTGLSFMQKGSALSVEGSDDDFVTKFNFLDIAPSVSYNITEALSANVGPYVGFALSGTQTVQEYDLTTGEVTTTQEAMDFDEEGAEVNKLDYGLNVGVSYVINEIIAINAGYSLGLADLNGADQGEYDFSQKTNGIRLSVVYIFCN